MYGSNSDSTACLVVVIPGIGGSVLESPKGDVLWQASLGAVRHLLRNPDSLAVDEIARPVGLIGNWALFPGLTVVHGYHTLMTSIGEAVGVNTDIDMGHPDNPKLDARVVAFPYDFRRSIAETAEELDRQIERRLAHLGWRNQPNRVIIIAHSMGGLIARYWVALGNWGLCRAILTLGTPHRGAPKALEYLVNGPPWWVPGRSELLRDLIRDWPAVYELVPRYQSVQDIRSQNNGSTKPLAMYPKDLPLRGLQEKITDAFTVHQHIEDAWERYAAETHCLAYIGRGHGTLLQATWDGKRLISSKDRPIWLDRPREERGDGTVPEVSASPIEQGNHLHSHFITQRHSKLATARKCISQLIELLENMAPSSRNVRAEDLPPMIGLDLEDSYLPGCKINVQARLIPRRLVSPRLSMAFTLTCDGNVVRHGWLNRGECDIWSTTFADLMVGTYEITVHAEPRDIFHLSTSECFFVLEE